MKRLFLALLLIVTASLPTDAYANYSHGNMMASISLVVRNVSTYIENLNRLLSFTPVHRLTAQASTPIKYYTFRVTKLGTGSGKVTGAGIECGSDCTQTVKDGTSIVVRAYPDQNYYRFIGWSGEGCSGTGTCTVKVSRDMEVKVYFDSIYDPLDIPIVQPSSFTLTIKKVGLGGGLVSAPGISCGTECVRTDSKWTSIRLQAIAFPDSYFSGWSGGGCSGRGECEILLNQNYTVTATFLPYTKLKSQNNTQAVVPVQINFFPVIVKKLGTGSGTVKATNINCGSDCKEVYKSGTQITLTPTANPGSFFSGWSDSNCAGKINCVVKVTKSITVSAKFDNKSLGVNAYYEAEDALLSDSMSAIEDPDASHGKYISSGVRDFGKAIFSINIPTTGKYIVWARIKSQDDNSDSFYISGDTGKEDIYDTAEQLWSPFWQWTRVTARNDNGGHPSVRNINPKLWNFTAGSRKITFRSRDPYTKLDQIFVTSSTEVTPKGFMEAKVMPVPKTDEELGLFYRNLTIGSQGNDVAKLQQFLNSQGFLINSSGIGSPGKESNYYGNATAGAVARFQNKYSKDILAPSGLTQGTGVFDALTRKKVRTMTEE